MGQNDVLAVVQLDAKHRAGQDRDDLAFDFDYVSCVIQCHVSGTIYTEGHLWQWFCWIFAVATVYDRHTSYRLSSRACRGISSVEAEAFMPAHPRGLLMI